MIFAGGGIPTGQVIGATDVRGEDPIDRRVEPGDFLATIYKHLQIDYANVAIENFTGRPVPILNSGKPIPELSACTDLRSFPTLASAVLEPSGNPGNLLQILRVSTPPARCRLLCCLSESSELVCESGTRRRCGGKSYDS
jgi:hypothetical protein